MSDRCEECGRPFDQPSHCDLIHVRADLPWRIVLAIEEELNGRRGIGWDQVDDETQDEIRESLAGIVQRNLEGKAPYGLCPQCGLPGRMRERRPNGNDTCESGHTYPSMEARSR